MGLVALVEFQAKERRAVAHRAVARFAPAAEDRIEVALHCSAHQHFPVEVRKSAPSDEGEAESVQVAETAGP